MAQFEDDDDSPVKLPPGHLMDADEVKRYEEVESSLAPPMMRDRSRALSTQKKLEQLEQERERMRRAKEKKLASGGAPSKTDMQTGSSRGLKPAEESDSGDDLDEDEDGSRVAKIISAPAGSGVGPTPSWRAGSNGSATSGGGADSIGGRMTQAERKLAALGLASEVDHSGRPSSAASSADTRRHGDKGATASAAAATAGGTSRGAAMLNGSATAASAAASGPVIAAAAAALEAEEEAPPLDLNDIKSFVLACIPASHRTPVQCYIKRVRKGLQKLWPYYVLYSQDPERFLLSGRRRKKNKQSTYLISTDEKDLSRHSDAYSGKVKSNFVGTEFTIYDSGGNPSRLEPEELVRMELGVVQYDRNVLGTNGPRKMQVFLPSCTRGGTRESLQPRRVEDCMSMRVLRGGHNYIRLINKTPRWNDSLGAFCLNFQGRVTVASVKNFQLVDELEQDRIVLQFGKCSDDTFTMDYSYPLCALQAFAICLSSFDHKLACE